MSFGKTDLYRVHIFQDATLGGGKHETHAYNAREARKEIEDMFPSFHAIGVEKWHPSSNSWRKVTKRMWRKPQ